MFSNALRSFAARTVHEGLWRKHRLHMLSIHTRCTRSQGLSPSYFMGSDAIGGLSSSPSSGSGANSLGGRVYGLYLIGGGLDTICASIAGSDGSASVLTGSGLHACTAPSAAPINIMPRTTAVADVRTPTRSGRLLGPHITTDPSYLQSETDRAESFHLAFYARRPLARLSLAACRAAARAVRYVCPQDSGLPMLGGRLIFGARAVGSGPERWGSEVQGRWPLTTLMIFERATHNT